MRYILTTDEMLILRDGRPFGEGGMFGGNSVNWPFPQTLAGMVRTAVGFSRDSRYFDTPKHVDEILKVGISKILPMAKTDGKWKPLMPAPADLVLTRKNPEIGLTVNPLIYKTIEDGAGTDIANRQWLLPSVDLRDKPAKDVPFFFHWDFYDNYIKDRLKRAETHAFEDIGIHDPISDVRVHNAIDPRTFTTEESRLFSNAGFYMKGKNGKEIIDLAICFEVVNADSNDISGDVWLGGERKRVVLTPTDMTFPECPDYFRERKFLKYILTSHGDFGGWCPRWLKPDLDAKEIEWVVIPNTTFEIRLRSACVNGWDGVSGWDYQTRKPKGMKKLVRPGSVFVIEIKNPDESAAIAKHLWGGSLDIDNEAAVYNGYGQGIIGNATVKEDH